MSGRVEETVGHTPGPWDVRPGYTEVRCGGGRVVAECYNYGRDSAENAANARLIAAAPDLLEALREAFATLNHTPRHPSQIGETLEILRDAIQAVEAEGDPDA